MREFVFCTLLLMAFFTCGAQTDSIAKRVHFTEYPFIILDSPAKLFTMRQVNENYISAYRLYANFLNNNFKPWVSYSIQAASFLVFFEKLTHEEAHLSILTGNNIVSFSLPYSLSGKSGYVNGVTDQTLKNLRDTNFPNFMRLYTAGFESDYLLNWRAQSLMSFGDEAYKNMGVEYILRKIMLMQYTLIGFFKYDVDEPEETDELQRDVVGNDFYGSIRHLFRPTMEFKRYTLYNELTDQELSYMRRIGFRTFINLIDPNLFGFSNFGIGKNLKINAALGHLMCPFGDFIDEKLWVLYRDKLKVSIYLRQFENENYWFWGGGAGVSDFQINNKVSATIKVHWWDQPVNFGFAQQVHEPGGAVELKGKYRFYPLTQSGPKAVSVNIGVIYKTKGYLPEEFYLQQHLGINVGLSIYLPR